MVLIMASFLGLAAAGVYLAYLILTLSLLYVGYCVVLHPLRQYPGPLVAKFTEAYGGYLAIRKSLNTTTHQTFLKYGSVVRVAPTRLVFNTVAALQDIYLTPKVVKGIPFHYMPLSTDERGVQNVIDKDAHKKKRKVVGSVLNERSMRIFESTMSARIDEFLQLLYVASQSDQSLNVAPLSQNLAMDIAANLGFGQDLHLQTNDTYRFISDTLRGWMRLMNINMELTRFKRLVRLMLRFRSKQTTRFALALRKIVQARMVEGKDARHDFYSVATEIGADEKFFASELWAEAAAFLAAGGLSTGTSIASTFFYLSRYPDCYNALAREIRTSFATSEEIKAGPQLNSCKYLRACIEESLRCAPPVFLPSWREQAPNDKSLFVVDGHVIPRGTQVAVPVYSLFHNEDIFEDSYAYRPERWLKPDGPETEHEQALRNEMRKAFVPFMLGDRNCAGQAMAWMELSLTIARTLWYFDFDKAPGQASKLGESIRSDGNRDIPEYKMLDIFVAEHDGPNLVFRERGNFAKELKTKGQ